MESLKEHQQAYRKQHSTLGCKITHMVGVPLIGLSLPTFLVEWHVALIMFTTGWILQFVGHYVFEKNTPVFIGNPLNPLTYLSALLFVANEWRRLFTGRSLVEPSIKGS